MYIYTYDANQAFQDTDSHCEDATSQSPQLQRRCNIAVTAVAAHNHRSCSSQSPQLQLTITAVTV